MDNIIKEIELIEETIKGVKAVSLSEFDPSTTLLSVIDINNGFARKGALYSDRVEVKIDNIALLSEKALDMGMKVHAYNDYHKADANEFGAHPSHCVEGTQESRLVDELEALKPKGLKEIRKNSTNGVLAYNPIVEDKEIKNHLVVGCVTDICVYQYAITLRTYLNQHELEGEVYVSVDQVQTYHIDGVHHGDLMHNVFLKSLMDNGVKVVKNIEID